MSARIYTEGGGSKSVDIELRAGFKRLWERCGFQGRLPRMFPSGSRRSAFEDFESHVATAGSRDFVALLVDSEDPVDDIERTWGHLRQRDQWAKPASASDDQVMLMTTCMETWIVADRDALRQHYSRRNVNENQLPPLTNLESRSRQDVQSQLRRATESRYSKGVESFKILGELNPDTLERHLPSFKRARGILDEKLRRRSGR